MKWIPLFLLITYGGCATTKNKNVMPGAFDKQGHRGCRGLMPENTWVAMKAALDLGVTTLEMDVVVTHDKKIILSHEPFFSADITTKPDGKYVLPEEEHQLNIYRMDYEQVLHFDVGMKPHPRFPKQQKLKAVKPTLEDLIKSAAQYAVASKRPVPFYNIEIKSDPAGDESYHPSPPDFVNLVMSVIQAAGIEDRVIIQSFDFRSLRYLHQHFPLIKSAMLVETLNGRSLETLLQELGYVPNIYSPLHTLVDQALVTACHEKGIRIIPWTVNERLRIMELKAMGVDGIITDYPDLF